MGSRRAQGSSSKKPKHERIQYTWKSLEDHIAAIRGEDVQPDGFFNEQGKRCKGSPPPGTVSKVVPAPGFLYTLAGVDPSEDHRPGVVPPRVEDLPEFNDYREL